MSQGQEYTAREHEIEVVRYILRVFRRHIRAMVLIWAVVVGAAFVRTKYLVPEIYATSITLMSLRKSPSLEALAVQGPLLQSLPSVLPQSLDEEYIPDLLRSRTILERVVQAQNLFPWLLREELEEYRPRVPLSKLEYDAIAVLLVADHPEIIRGMDPEDPERGILTMSSERLSSLVAPFVREGTSLEESDLSEIRRAWYALVSGLMRSLVQSISIDQPRGSRIITITVELGDPMVATRVANQFAETLREYLQENTLTTATRNREFLEERFEEVQRRVQEVEKHLEAFKVEHGLVDLPTQASELARQIAQLKARLEANRIQIRISSQSGVSPDNPQFRSIVYENQALEDRLNRLLREESLSVSTFPALERELAQIMREKTVQDTLFRILAEQYEQAKIQEQKETEEIRVLDPAQPPVRRIRPRRQLDMVVGGVLGVLVAIAYAFLAEIARSLWPLARETWSEPRE